MSKLARKGSPWASGIGLVTVALSAEVANVITVTIDFKTPNNKAFAERVFCDAYLSTDEGGGNLTASAPSGGVAATTGVCIEHIADKSFKLISNAAGRVVLTIEESTVKDFYLVFCLPDNTLYVKKIAFA